MDIKKTGQFTLDYEHLLQNPNFQDWIVDMLIENSRLIDPCAEQKTDDRHHEHHTESALQRAK